MTKHTPIPLDQIEAHARWRRARDLLAEAVDMMADMPGGQAAIGEALCGALETVGGGAPQYQPFGDMRADARFWADCATPLELEAYAGAALRRIDRVAFAERARKRVFWELWQTMAESDRQAFLAKVGEG